ncbi:MAG: excinuclease ABC subunit UvrB, partial [Balneolaceae bacterium]|nr:excinuclease ABC subunit UvrB [Balneolaceae bacterium]
MSQFKLHSPWEPAGDQPNAIKELTEGIRQNDQFQTLLGITGSGKTRTVAGVIENVQKPTLVMSHNKTLAAQLYRELSDFFPENRVEFFISYYDYYQPEAYISAQDKYIEKDLSINEEIQRLRLRATSSLLSGRRDVIIVSSVSCIYGIGSPSEYEKLIITLKTDQEIPRNTLLYDLVDLHYTRSDNDFRRGTFRVRGDVVDIYPAYSEEGLRVTMWGDEIEKMQVFNVETGDIIDDVDEFRIYPASHYVTTQSRLEDSIQQIRDEMHWRVDVLQNEQKFLEAKRLEQRTLFDIEMMQEIGYCSGIENYSRYLSARKPGERPYCLMDYFPDDYLLVVDESHQTVPQIGAMYGGDRSRKIELVEHGFRLPSALDNRPLTFEEWETMINQAIFVSATPGDYELEQSGGVYVEQIIRPTGLMEPEIEVRPLDTQVDDLLEEIRLRADKNERVLCITLTKRLSEELSEYLKNLGIPAAYMHSELDAMQRVEVLYKYRRGDFKVLVGINLLREGIDIPELSLVAIMDADKEGFLRSETSLFQIVGRAARNVEGKAILYADKITNSMQKVIDETNRRRKVQEEYNREHGITPQTIKKELKPLVDPALISTQDFTLDPQSGEEEKDYLEVVKVAEEGIQYKANPA